MNVFYEEEGELKAALILSDKDSSLQVESPHGKRGKLKSSSILFRFPSPGPGALMSEAETLAGDLDVELLWSCCSGDREWGFAELAKEYTGHDPTPVELAAILLRLQASPMYFYRKGRGHYRPAPEANLKAALAGLERKRQQELQKQQALEAIQAGRFPEWMAAEMPALLYRPDKNTLAWKTLEAASAIMHLTAPQVLAHCGVLKDSRSWHEGKFQFEYFGPLDPAAVYAIHEPSAWGEPAHVEAFSIDDASTTEIDDALSVAKIDDAHWRVGIHIAAPGLGFSEGSPLDEIARGRLSTVYMPGRKIPMLPDQVIRQYSLHEGEFHPVLSLYLTVRLADGVIMDRQSRVDRVKVASNLRLNELDAVFDPENEADDRPHFSELRFLWRLARTLSERRTEGLRPSPQYQDYTFHVSEDRVSIVPRPRGSPLDTLVAELMIEVNSQWGKLLADAGAGALYRVQSNGKTGLSVQPAPHEGLGVQQYAWASSPLRRYVDLVNQWQLIGLLSGLPLPFSGKETELESVARSFEMAYDAYNEFQRQMERYWCLRWLEQEQVTTSSALMLREGMARINGLPLVVKVLGGERLPPGTKVQVELERINLWDMTVVTHLSSVVADS